MYLTLQNILLISSILLFLSIVAGSKAYKYGVPTLILFLAIGMFAGTDGVLGIEFDNPDIAQFIGVVALNFILFSGGMDTKFKDIKPIAKQGISLSTLGVICTAACTGLFVYMVTDFTLAEALLLGSIVSSTDAAAVFSMLGSSKMELKNNLKPTLELESGSNDPMAYLLTIIFLSFVQNPEVKFLDFLLQFAMQMGIGIAIGYLMGVISTFLVKKIKPAYSGLYPVLVIAFMFFTYSITTLAGGNGFLAVYITAIYFGNQVVPQKQVITTTFDGFAWLMQIVLFITLGLLVFPSQIPAVMGIGILISLFIVFAARPLSVFISLLFSKVNLRSKLFISWVGLRGAAPIVFATYPLIAGIEKAGMIFNIVFFISLTSMLLQGSTIPLIAKWLKVSNPKDKRFLKRKELDIKTELVEFEVQPDSNFIGKTIAELKLPHFLHISSIQRDDEYVIPKGSVKLQSHDVISMICKDVEAIPYFDGVRQL